MRRIVKATRISQVYKLHPRMILQQIQCPLKANYPIIFFRGHSYIVGKYSLELPISQTSTFSKGIHVYLRLIDYLTDSVMRSLVVTICIDQPLYEKAFNQTGCRFQRLVRQKYFVSGDSIRCLPNLLHLYNGCKVHS